jgi:hypothetical protein
MTSPASEYREERPVLEPRWPIAVTLGFFIAVSIVLRVAVPHRSSLGPDWLVPGGRDRAADRPARGRPGRGERAQALAQAARDRTREPARLRSAHLDGEAHRRPRRGHDGDEFASDLLASGCR